MCVRAHNPHASHIRIRMPLTPHSLVWSLHHRILALATENDSLTLVAHADATVKENVKSTVEEQLKYNVGPIIPGMMAEWKGQIKGTIDALRRKQVKKRVRWPDSRWIEMLKEVINQREENKLPSFTVRIGTLCSSLRVLDSSKGENVLWQVQQFFLVREAQYLSLHCRDTACLESP